MSGPFFFPEIAGIKSCANFRSANCGLKSLASQHRLKVLTIGWPVVALTSRGQESGSPNTQLNATLRNNFSGQRQRPETVPAIQSADCRDKMRARIAASSGLFALNRKSPFAQDGVVELGGLEPPTKRSLSKDGRSTAQPFCQLRA